MGVEYSFRCSKKGGFVQFVDVFGGSLVSTGFWLDSGMKSEYRHSNLTEIGAE